MVCYVRKCFDRVIVTRAAVSAPLLHAHHVVGASSSPPPTDQPHPPDDHHCIIPLIFIIAFRSTTNGNNYISVVEYQVIYSLCVTSTDSSQSGGLWITISVGGIAGNSVESSLGKRNDRNLRNR